MKQQPRDVGASVRARLLERARKERSDFQLLLTRYVLERLLYRLSVSVHRDSFVLKGAILLSALVSDRFRATRDLDLLGSGDSRPEALAEVFRVICTAPVADDGVIFDTTKLETMPIRAEAEYGGVRIRMAARVGGARIPVQIDVGFGDTITPGPVEIDYPVLLQSPAPRLRVYPVETIVAEKFEALVGLGMANSRLKDYYDLWLIFRSFKFEQQGCAEAVRRTFERRGTPLPVATPIGLTSEFVTAWATPWRTFLGRERMAAVPDNLAVVVTDLRNSFDPIIRALTP